MARKSLDFIEATEMGVLRTLLQSCEALRKTEQPTQNRSDLLYAQGWNAALGEVKSGIRVVMQTLGTKL